MAQMILRLAFAVVCIVSAMGTKAENLPSGWELISTHRQWMQEHCPKPEDLSEKELMLECARLINYTLREPQAKALIQAMAGKVPEFNNYLAWLDSNTEDLLMERHIAALSALYDYAAHTYGEATTIAGWCRWYELGFRTIMGSVLAQWDPMIENQEKAVKKEGTKEAKALLYIMRIDKANVLENHYLVDDPTYYPEILKLEKEVISLYPQDEETDDPIRGYLYLVLGQAFTTITNTQIYDLISSDYIAPEKTYFQRISNGMFSPALFYMETGLNSMTKAYNPGDPQVIKTLQNITLFTLYNLIPDETVLNNLQTLQDYYRGYGPMNSLDFLNTSFQLSTTKYFLQLPNDEFFLSDFRFKEYCKIMGDSNDAVPNTLIGIIYQSTIFQPSQVENLLDQFDEIIKNKYKDNPLKLALFKYLYFNFKDISPERSIKNLNEARILYSKNRDGSPISLYLGENGFQYSYYTLGNNAMTLFWLAPYIEDLTQIYGAKSQIVYNNRLNFVNAYWVTKPDHMDVYEELISDMKRDRINPSTAYFSYGISLANQSNFSKAKEQMLNATKYYQDESPSFQAQVLLNIVNMQDWLGEPASESNSNFTKACQLINQPIDTLLMDTNNWLMASDHLVNIGSYKEALDYAEQGLEIYNKQGLSLYSKAYLDLLSAKNKILYHNFNQQRLAIQLMLQQAEEITNDNFVYYTTDIIDFLWQCYYLIIQNNAKDYSAYYFISRISNMTNAMYAASGEDIMFRNTYLIPMLCEGSNYMITSFSMLNLNDIDVDYIPEQTKANLQNMYNTMRQQFKEYIVMLENCYNEYLTDPIKSGISKNSYQLLTYALGQYSEYEQNFEKAENYYKQFINSKHEDGIYTDGIFLLYDLYTKLEDKEKLSKEVKNLQQFINNPSFSLQTHLALISRLNHYYYITEQWNDQLPYAREFYITAKNIMDVNFNLMSQKEQNNLMTAFGDPAGPIISLLSHFPNELAAESYNALLYRTGMQLRSQISTKKILSSIDNPEAFSLQDSLVLLQNQDKLLYNLTESGENDPIIFEKKTKLNFDILRIEQKLLQFTEEYSMEQMPDVTWSDVQGKLKADEAAIEITYSDMYSTALIVRPGYDRPQVVKLCHADSLTNALQSLGTKQPHRLAYRLYGDKSKVDLYSMLWQPLEQYLSGVDRVYLSVEGILNYLSFPAIKVDPDTYLFDKYDICQLTTTAEIVTNKPSKMPESALLLGALYYSPAQQQLDPFAQWSEGDDLALSNGEEQHRAIDDFDEAERGGNDHFVYLQNTPAELNNVSKAISAHAMPTTLLKDRADESSFRQALASKPQLLHMATHGFFLPTEGDAMKIPFFKRYMSSVGSSMQRAGFALSLAEDAWCGADLVEDNDGIVTADEVAQLDLSDTQLVTISACESALGDYSYEGVYGLPRGFKQAGAKSLLVSLWSVSDASTSLLMSTFYREWMGGKPMRQAYREAMTEVRKQYPHPYYWASFQLLDALD